MRCDGTDVSPFFGSANCAANRLGDDRGIVKGASGNTITRRLRDNAKPHLNLKIDNTLSSRLWLSTQDEISDHPEAFAIDHRERTIQ